MLSSESQAIPGSIAVRRSRSNLSTAMSASLTGDEAPLVHCLSGVPNSDSANAPASRTAAAKPSARRTASDDSLAGNSQTLHAHGRRVGAVAENEIVCRCEAFEDLRQMP